MPPGRPSKPRRLKGLSGTDRASRQRNAPAVSAVDCIAAPPWLLRRAAELWMELAPGLQEHGLLSERDIYTFALLCDAAEKIEALHRVLTPEFVIQQAAAAHYPQAVSLLKFYTKQYHDASARLGFSPLDRQRLDVPSEADTPDAIEREFFDKRTS